MATVTEKPQSGPPQQPAAAADQQLIERQINRTRRALKLVDLTAGLITLTIGVLLYLLAAAVLEHWVIPGGWSTTARTVLWGLLACGILWFAWRRFWPLLSSSINPIYAAREIEESSPGLKNSLLNLLMLRGGQRRLSQQVYQAIERQAAQGLSQISLDAVVDRSAIIRLGYVLLGVLAIFVLYSVLSPKNILTTASRVLLPWADIAAASRVQILNVTPGETKVARGDQLRVTAEVLGLEEDEPVKLLYTTADKQIVRQEIPLTSSPGGSEYRCDVPSRLGLGGSGGVQQDFVYWLEAGDARSPRYEVAVYARPTLVVNRLRYEYPAYTGIPSSEVEHTGDIRAVEGTKVTLFAQANKPIKSAHVDFAADGRRDLLMKSSELQASVTFPLELRDDRRTPRHQSYVLRYLTTDGNENQLPPKYRIEVQPDYAPEVQLLLPEEAMLEVALNQEVNFELEARDPDYALSQVVLLGRVGEQEVVKEQLLQQQHTGRFVGKLRKTPEQLGLQVGDVLEYWGAAADNRRPEANLAYSPHRKLRVVGPWQGNQGDQQGEGEQGEGQQPGEGEQQEGEGGDQGNPGGGEQGNAGEGQEGQQGQGGAGDQGQQDQSEQQGDSQGESSGNSQGESGSSEGQSGQNQSEGSDSQGENTQQGDSQSDSNGEPDSAGGDPNANQSAQNEKVSAAGDEDAEAFERMADHFREQAEDQGENQGEAGQQGEQSQTEGAEGENTQAQSSEQSDSQGEQREASGEQTESQGEQDQQGESQGEQGQQGEQGEQAKSEGAQDESASAEGQPSPEQGDPGAGQKQGEDQGSPTSEQTRKPQEKESNDGESASLDGQPSEPPTESADQSESDSEDGQSGDRSGGGQEGAGQQAEAEGQGAAGEQEAADQGAGQAQEQGEGEAGQRAGDQQATNEKTGEASSQEGQAREGQGEQPDSQGDSDSAESSSQPGEASQQPDQGENTQPQDQTQQNPNTPPGESASADGQHQGPPNPAGGPNSTPPPAAETQPGDEANLEYARKQTDLILDRLEDQLDKQQVDQSLLEKLGWSKDELRRFVDRWKNLKAEAETPDTSEANTELDDALRSLGLRPQQTGYRAKVTQDKLRDLQDAYRGRVPLEYQDQVRSYLKGTAAGDER